MNLNLQRYRILPFLVLTVMAVPGCASIHPITTKPLVKKIIVSRHFTAPYCLAQVALPAGVYRPAYEDKEFFYYEAPGKVVVSELPSQTWDGGIYVERCTRTPRGWYYFDQDDVQHYGRFETPPPAVVR